MSIDSISILYIAAGVLFVILFGKALELLVERAAPFFVGKKINGDDLLRIELNALSIKTETLKMKLDALKNEVRALDTKMETTSSQVAEQLSIVPTLPTISKVVSEATRGRDASKGQCKEEDTWSKATIEGHREQQDTWTRPAVENDDTSVAPTISKLIPEDTWTR